jgi:CheY-like chemotaxis protein
MGRIAYLCTDLLFTSKIREVARGLGLEVSGARDVEALAATARGADAVIVDLRLPAALDALIRLRADPATAEVPAIGFCDHENVDLMARARDAGCTQVLAKGKFSSDLPRLLGS